MKEPVYDLAGLLEKSGVKLYTHSFGWKDNFWGMSVAKEEGGPVIAVNISPSITNERQLFTAAHELGHLLLHPKSYDYNQLQENEAEENEADQFASYFLMPNEGFRKRWEGTKGLHWIDRVVHTKRIFHVSYLTVLHRLAFERKAYNELCHKFRHDYKERYKRTIRPNAEPFGLTTSKGLNKSGFMDYRLNRLVREAFENDLISMSKAAEVISVPLEEMHELVRSWST